MAPTPIFRPTARILVTDPEGRVLLFSARDARGARWWFTPGGAVRRGETTAAAAVRELAEETGHLRSEAELGPVMATAAGLWWSAEEDKLFLGAHSFFFVRVRNAGIDTRRQEELERSMITGHRWWTTAELAAATEMILPSGLAGLLDRLLRGDIPARPVRLATRERRRPGEGSGSAGAGGSSHSR